MKKIAVITSSIGANKLYEPTLYTDIVDYHAFVDENYNHSHSAWNMHYVKDFSIDRQFPIRRAAKFPKILPHLAVPGYDYYIWIDATNQLKCDPNSLINKYLDQDTDLALFMHTRRSCVYDEIKICRNHKLDTPDRLNGIEKFLTDSNFPKNAGLPENTCRIQRNTPAMNYACMTWWEMICKYSSRDQLSLPFVLRSHSIKYNALPGGAQEKNDFMPHFQRGTQKREHK